MIGSTQRLGGLVCSGFEAAATDSFWKEGRFTVHSYYIHGSSGHQKIGQRVGGGGKWVIACAFAAVSCVSRLESNYGTSDSSLIVSLASVSFVPFFFFSVVPWFVCTSILYAATEGARTDHRGMDNVVSNPIVVALH